VNEGSHNVLVSVWVVVGFNVNWDRLGKKGNMMVVGSGGVVVHGEKRKLNYIFSKEWI